MGAVAPGMNIEIVKNKKIQTNMILFYKIHVGVSSCRFQTAARGLGLGQREQVVAEPDEQRQRQ
jgi:hypothetical protein